MDGSCPVCDGEPSVLVVMRHPTMRLLTRELLEREFNCWVATEAHTDEGLTGALDRISPDLMIIDAGDSRAAAQRRSSTSTLTG
jgi:DNA-binding NarL/FixJ family response regulator